MPSVFNYNLYLPAAALLFVFTLVLVAKFQPYKNKRNNTVDIIMLLAVISGYMSTTMYYAGGIIYPKWLSEITSSISVLILLSYQVFLILAHVLPKATQCFKKCKTHLMSKMNGVNVVDRALLNHGHADYNA